MLRGCCFGGENSPSSAANSCEFYEKFGEFALAHRYKAERNSLSSLSLSSRNSVRGKTNSLSSVFETVLSETIFGRFPKRETFCLIPKWLKRDQKMTPMRVFGHFDLLVPLFLMGCFLPRDFREGKRPIKAFGETAH